MRCILQYGIGGILAAITIYDFLTNKIRNGGILLLFLLGLFLRLQCLEFGNLSQSAINLLLPIILLYPLFLMHVLGAGDLKLFSVIGLFMTTNQLLYWLEYSFATGAIIGLILLLYHKNLGDSMRRFYRYSVETAMSFPKVLPYKEMGVFDRQVIHFSLPMLIGYVVMLVTR